MPPGAAAAAAAAAPGWPTSCGTARAALGAAGVKAAVGVRGAFCDTADGPGCGGSGSTGSAEAMAPAKTKTPTVAAATLVAGVLQRRAISFIDVGPSTGGARHALGSGADCIQGEGGVTRAGTHLEPSSDRPVTEPRPTRGRLRPNCPLAGDVLPARGRPA